MADYYEWLAGLQPGQPVAMYERSHPGSATLAEVSRRTPTLVVVLTERGERKFKADTGRQVGGSTELRPVDSPPVVDALVRQAYAGAMYAVYEIERRVDRTNPRTSELYAVALREATKAFAEASAAVDTLLGSEATEGQPGDVEE